MVVRVSWCLIADSQQQVLRSVSALVLNRCNSTATVTQVRPEEWVYAKPFENIPGSKPLPRVGNTWRFIPYIGNVNYCIPNSFKPPKTKRKYAANICSIHVFESFIIKSSKYIFIMFIIVHV
jgi:hypothetical protein